MESNQAEKNKSSTNIPKKHTTELNELIYAGAKLVYEKTGIPLKSTNKKSKPGWEFRLETQIRKLRKQVKMIKQKKKTKTKNDRMMGEKGKSITRKGNDTT